MTKSIIGISLSVLPSAGDRSTTCRAARRPGAARSSGISPGVLPGDTFYRLFPAGRGESRALAYRAEQGRREVRARLDEVEEGVPADREEPAVGLAHDGGEPRRAVDQSHLAEHAARAYLFHDLPFDRDGEAAFGHHVHEDACLAFGEHGLAAL